MTSISRGSDQRDRFSSNFIERTARAHSHGEASGLDATMARRLTDYEPVITRMESSKETKYKRVNVGCGPTGKIEGFDNLDNSPSILLSRLPLLKKVLYYAGIITEQQCKADWSNVIRCDASKKLQSRSGIFGQIDK